jgi:uncharacterized protein (DUF1015 family)
MATIKPFAALRPKPELAAQICELPYDVLSSEEARELARNNPLSFFHVSKPEIDLPADTDPCSPAVYDQGRKNLDHLVREGALRRETGPRYYLYRQIMGHHSQTGLVAVASCQDYLNNVIRKHEFTRPDKEDDRVRHIEALDAQTGPVFLTYRADESLDKLLQSGTKPAPEIDFTAPDGVRHSAWSVSDAGTIHSITDAFDRIPRLYIADGHHRSAAAARVFQARQGAGGSAFFLSVIFPHSQMQILPYNRVLKDLNGRTPARLLEELDAVFVIKAGGGGRPLRKNWIGFFIDGKWHTLHFRPQYIAAGDPGDRLDATLLQKHVLDPIFGITDPRTSDRIRFVGGIRGTGELEQLVTKGGHACAFSMFPTCIEDLMEIADTGGIMPPKSTWFEPKLRDAMFSHVLD